MSKSPLEGQDRLDLIEAFEAAKAAIIAPLDARNDSKSEKIRLRVQEMVNIRYIEFLDNAITQIKNEGGISRPRRGMLKALMDQQVFEAEVFDKPSKRYSGEELALYKEQAAIFHDRFVEQVTPLLSKERTPTIKPGMPR